jgi:membrane protein
MSAHQPIPPWLDDRKFATRHFWCHGEAGTPPQNKVARSMRVLDLAVRGLGHNDATTHAAAMTYTTVLSLVPLLAFVFTMAKTFGGYEMLVDKQLIPMLDEYVPRGDEGAGQLRAAIDQVLGFVGQTDASKLGAAGLVAFLYTAIGLLRTLEHSFNRIFRLPGDRGFGRRLIDYTALLVLSPVLLAMSVGAMTAVQSNSIVTWLQDTLHLGPVLTVIFKSLGGAVFAATFAFLFVFIPNTKVSVKSGLIGGVVGFLLWAGLLVLLVKAQVGVAGYNSLYAGFAAFPIFLFWIYLSWIATMLGAHIVWAHQMEPQYAEMLSRGPIHSKNREENAVRLLCELDNAYRAGGKPLTPDALSRTLGLSRATIEDLVADLERREIVVRAAKGNGVLLQGDGRHVSLHAVVAAVRNGDTEETPGMDAIDRALVALRKQEASVSAGERSIQTLAKE